MKTKQELPEKELLTLELITQMCIHSFIAEGCHLEIQRHLPKVPNQIRHEFKYQFKRLGHHASRLVDMLHKAFTLKDADDHNALCSDVSDVAFMLSVMNPEHRSKVKEYAGKLFEQYKK